LPLLFLLFRFDELIGTSTSSGTDWGFAFWCIPILRVLAGIPKTIFAASQQPAEDANTNGQHHYRKVMFCHFCVSPVQFAVLTSEPFQLLV
jgi:hypothetical protein